jgi:cell division transport system permease protein
MSAGGLRRRLRAWGRRQLYSFFSSLGTLLSHRLGTLMTVLVLGIAMLLPLGLYVSVKNLRALDLQQQDWGTITVFLQHEAGENDALALAERVEQQHGAGVETVSPLQGMEEFREASGFGQALGLFEENPLPWVLLVTPLQADDAGLEETVSELAGWLEVQDRVDLVQVDYKWLKRLAGLLELGGAFVTVLTVMFSLAVVVVVANTIRLDVANRAEEIQVLNMVGAGNSFIRQPFLYSGFWYGLLGALLALLLLSLSMFYLQRPLESLLDAYGNTFEVNGLGGRGMLFVLLAGGLLGFVGAWVSVRRYLRQFRLEKARLRR